MKHQRKYLYVIPFDFVAEPIIRRECNSQQSNGNNGGYGRQRQCNCGARHFLFFYLFIWIVIDNIDQPKIHRKTQMSKFVLSWAPYIHTTPKYLSAWMVLWNFSINIMLITRWIYISFFSNQINVEAHSVYSIFAEEIHANRYARRIKHTHKHM